MSTQLQLRRGTTAQHSTFTGASGEITIDTDKKTVVVHDGTTAGGMPVLPKTITDGTANGVLYLNGSKVATSGSGLTFDGTNLHFPEKTSVYFGNDVATSSGSGGDLTIKAGAGLGAGNTSGNLYLAAGRGGSSATNGSIYFGYSQATNSGGLGGTLMTLDSSGNLGIGVTPSAWNSSFNVFQIGATGSLYGRANTGYDQAGFYSNARFASGTNDWRYLVTATASGYGQAGGAHYWYTAPSGTAGNAITFTQAMTLDASGHLGLVGDLKRDAADTFNIKNPADGGSILLYAGTTSGYQSSINANGGGASNPNTIIFKTASTERMRLDSSGNLLPGTDNAYSCGNSGRRWNAVWAAIGTIQTSDEREKTEIVDSPLGLDFINGLRPVAYKFKVGGNMVSTDEDGNEVITPVAGKRQHFGLLAQQVKQTLGDIDFGGWIQTDISDPESEQGLRYDEFISPLVKAIQEQQAIIESLTQRIEALEYTKQGE